MIDNEIVMLYWNRDESAITETQAKYGKYLTKIAYNITNDTEDSEESVNDTYLAAWNTIPPQRPGLLKTFLSKLTRCIAIDRVRLQNRKKRGGGEYTVSLDELSEITTGNTPDDTLDAKMLGEAVSAFLRTLSPDARNAFICRYYFLDSTKDVAESLEISTSKLKSLLHRTRISLREYLQKEGFDI